MNPSKLKSEIDSLAPYSLGSFRVASCYLDATQGIDSCLSWLGEEVARIRFYDSDSQDRSDLILNLKAAINEQWDSDMQTLALFWRVGHDASLICSIPLPIHSNNRLSVYRQPDIRPMLPLLNEESNAIILAYLAKQVHIFDVSLGQVKAGSWALAPHLSEQPVSSNPDNLNIHDESQLKTLCISLLHLKHKPLILAAKSDDIAKLKA